MKKYAFILPILLFIYFITYKDNTRNVENQINNKNKIKNNEKTVTVFYNNINTIMDEDDYVLGVLACEMPALFNEEALKAGAVAIRTFLRFKEENVEDYVAKTTDQCFNNEEDMKLKWSDNYEKYYKKLKNIILETKDEVIVYDNKIIEAFYFAISNGQTENVINVFNINSPYLISVDSSWDKNVNNYEVVNTFSKEEFLKKLGFSEDEKLDIKLISKNESDHIEKISINNKLFSAIEFRKLLKIRSTDFDISTNDASVKITTRGYGHGVGMSQYGANEMAKMGYNYKDILKHYYTGVEITKIDV